jgi:hypothetical protein
MSRGKWVARIENSWHTQPTTRSNETILAAKLEEKSKIFPL